MKLESLLHQLEQVRIEFEAHDFEEYSESYRGKVILQKLLDYIGNPRIEEKINEIPF